MDSLIPCLAARMSRTSVEARPLYLKACHPMRLCGSALNGLFSSRMGLRMNEEFFRTHCQSRSGAATGTGLGHLRMSGGRGVCGFCGSASGAAVASTSMAASAWASATAASAWASVSAPPPSSSSSGTGASGKCSSMISRSPGFASSILSAGPFIMITPFIGCAAITKLPCLSPSSRSTGVRPRMTPFGQKALSMVTCSSSSAMGRARPGNGGQVMGFAGAGF
mmetsp:Transcript_18875/g.59860  ORF Transcript_18875/g.59860 Transcript_18875/m.59860 type:complete len:223 (-) Transcript_18875:25-693(-)